MITAYNVDFLIAALIMLLLVLYHFRAQKKINDAGTHFFGMFLLMGILDVSLDLVCTFLIVEGGENVAQLSRILLTLFYMVQTLFPFLAGHYAQTLRNTSRIAMRRDLLYLGIGPVFMWLLILANYWMEFMFGFDGNGRYFRGEAYFLMYVYALLYVVAVICVCGMHFREYKKKDMYSIGEFLLIEGICVGIQLMHGEYLVIGFGIGLGITVMYLLVNNPQIYIDAITGAFNKKYFDIWMQDQLYKKKPIHILCADINNLSRINKVFGTTSGDGILIEMVRMIQKNNETIQIFRIAGKRFLLVMNTVAEYEACREDMKKILGESFWIEEEEIHVSGVISGIVNAEKLGNRDTILAYLEYMSGLAKGAGNAGNTVLIQSDEQVMEGFHYEQEVEHFLGTAIEQDLFEVYYQPVYSGKKDCYVSLEVLSRLRHPALGYISPDVFITLAEKNGQIVSIGKLQFYKVCRFLKEHPEIMEHLITVKFNLSPKELLKSGHAQFLVDTIRRFELPFSWFQFEITETVATEYSASLFRAVEIFSNAGITLCLDDFGSGYANINTVTKMPFTCIKLDRSLLQDVGKSLHAASLYKSIVDVFRKMGYNVIAEGAETAQDVALLQSWNVEFIQGFYFSKPVPENRILEILAEKNG